MIQNIHQKLRIGEIRNYKLDSPPAIDDLIADITQRFGPATPFSAVACSGIAAITLGVPCVSLAIQGLRSVKLPLPDAQFSHYADAFKYACCVNIASPFSTLEQASAECYARYAGPSTVIAAAIHSLTSATTPSSIRPVAVTYEHSNGFSILLTDANSLEPIFQPIYSLNIPRGATRYETHVHTMSFNVLSKVTRSEATLALAKLEMPNPTFTQPLMSAWRTLLPVSEHSDNQGHLTNTESLGDSLKLVGL